MYVINYFYFFFEKKKIIYVYAYGKQLKKLIFQLVFAGLKIMILENYYQKVMD